jgi:ubiquinone/menaquinone biosynthesis C-methylase UbiE
MKKDRIKSAWQSGFYKDIEKRSDKIFREPHKDLPEFIKLLKQAKAKNVLDLGCGTGRHLVALAKAGFKVYGIDLTDIAIKIAKKWLGSENINADLIVCNIYEELPYKNNFFDGVISTKAMHHARVSQIKKLVKELGRVMRPGGILMVEVPRRKRGYERFKGQYKEIAPGTIVPVAGPEKGVPHYIFSNRKELTDLFPNFKILRISFSSGYNKISRNSHYTMFAKLK